MSQVILRGYHFMPTEEELIGILMAFLECRAQGKQFPPSPVSEKVLYGDDATPWKIFGEDDAWESVETDCGKKGGKEVVFVLTQLSAMSTKKKARTAGCGTWDGQTGLKEVKNRKGEIIGLSKMLSYRVKEGSESQSDKAQWRMHEYALAGVSLKKMELKHIYIYNYVICKITRDYTKGGNPTKDQILSKRKSEVLPETSKHPNKNFRRLMELVYSGAQDGQLNEQQLVNNMYPTTAYTQQQWAVESHINTSYPPSAAESKVNDSYPPSEAEASSNNYVIPPAAEASTTSNPEDGNYYMKDMDWVGGLTHDMEVIRNEFIG